MLKKTIFLILIATITLNCSSQKKSSMDYIKYKIPKNYTVEEVDCNRSFKLVNSDEKDAVFVATTQLLEINTVVNNYFLPNRSKAEKYLNGDMVYFLQYGEDELGRNIAKYIYKLENISILVLHYMDYMTDEDFQVFFKSLKIKFKYLKWEKHSLNEVQFQCPEYLYPDKFDKGKGFIGLTSTDYSLDNIDLYISVNYDLIMNYETKNIGLQIKTDHFDFDIYNDINGEYMYVAMLGEKYLKVYIRIQSEEYKNLNADFIQHLLKQLQPHLLKIIMLYLGF